LDQPCSFIRKHLRHGKIAILNGRRVAQQILKRHRPADFIIVQSIGIPAPLPYGRGSVRRGRGSACLLQLRTEFIEFGEVFEDSRELAAICLDLLIRQAQPGEFRHVPHFVSGQSFGHVGSVARRGVRRDTIPASRIMAAMTSRGRNERKFGQWLDLPDGGRRYWLDVAGHHGWRARYLKEVDSAERTVRFCQEIYDETGTLVEIHQKFPVDEGHRKV
jgi:hypothetical protein